MPRLNVTDQGLKAELSRSEKPAASTMLETSAGLGAAGREAAVVSAQLRFPVR